MIVHQKSDVWIGCRVVLSDGREAEVDQDTPDMPVKSRHEQCNVIVDGENLLVYTGETVDGSLYVKEILDEQPCPAEYPPEEPAEVDYLDEIFDGIDPNTFDGDILDLL